MFHQRLDEDTPRADIPHRKLVAEFKWSSVVKPAIEMWKRNISFVACSTGSGILENKIRKNFFESLKKTDIFTRHGHINQAYVESGKTFKKLTEIKDQLSNDKICFFCDTRILFLKNCFYELIEMIGEYDIVIMSDGGKLNEYQHNTEIVNPSLCIVKPSDFTRSLFYFKGSGPPVLNDIRQHVSYLNDKLNDKGKYVKNLKIKILDSNKYSMSDAFDATGDEAVINYDTESNAEKHPRAIIEQMKKNNHWYI